MPRNVPRARVRGMGRKKELHRGRRGGGTEGTERGRKGWGRGVVFGVAGRSRLKAELRTSRKCCEWKFVEIVEMAGVFEGRFEEIRTRRREGTKKREGGRAGVREGSLSFLSN